MAKVGKVYPYHFRRDLGFNEWKLWGLPKDYIWSGISATGVYASVVNGLSVALYSTTILGGNYVQYDSVPFAAMGKTWSFQVFYAVFPSSIITRMDWSLAYSPGGGGCNTNVMSPTTSIWPAHINAGTIINTQPANLTIVDPGRLDPKPW